MSGATSVGIYKEGILGNVVKLHTITTVDTTPESVLNGALEAGLGEVFVLGWKEDGTLYAAGSTSRIGDLLLMFEEFKKEII